MSDPELKSRLGLTVFDQTPSLIAVLDPQLSIVQANPSFEQTFGPRIGEPCYAVYKGRDRPCDPCPAAAVFADGTARVYEEEGTTATGERIAYQVQAAPVTGEGGQVELLVQICLNVTRMRELEVELKEAERLASVGLTTAGLAHTIKNILAGLEGGIYVINSGLERKDDGRVRSGWTMVQNYIEQVSTLVRNLLHYAREQEPRRESTDPAGLVERVVQLFEDKAELIGIEFIRDVERDLPEVSVDPEAMHACLTNLVSNSMDACSWDPSEGKDHAIRVSARSRPEGGVIFEVSDNGMGIAEEDRGKILTTHFTTKGMRGTGLGLLLTKKTVREHGGKISFTSTHGQGATFSIELPAIPEAPGR